MAYWSQSLFSWIHLSYEMIAYIEKLVKEKGLNPYFPGFIFLITRWGYFGARHRLWSQSLFSWIHLSYNIKKIMEYTKEVGGLNPYFPGFIFLMPRKKGRMSCCGSTRLNPYFPGFIFLIETIADFLADGLLESQSLFSWIHLSYIIKT